MSRRRPAHAMTEVGWPRVAPSRRLGPGRFIAAVLAGGACCAWAVTPVAAAPLQVQHRAQGGAGGGPQLSGTIEPQVCASCTPPLLYSGGPVMATNGANGLTVTPIWWQPSGGRFRFPTFYVDLLDQYIHDVAASSGGNDNIYSILTEYYEKSGGVKTYVTYKMTAGTPTGHETPSPPTAASRRPASRRASRTPRYVMSSGPLRPARSCPPRWPTTIPCSSHRGLKPKTSTARTLPAATAATTGASARAPTRPSMVICRTRRPTAAATPVKQPNGDLRADGEVSTFAHELAEAITDPLNPQFAWFDGKGNEIADMCDQNYGGALGSTDAAHPDITEYNQVSDGHKYYVQELFSNVAFAKSGVGKGCALSEALAENPKAAGTGTGATTIGYAFTDAFPTDVAANGKATSAIVVAVADEHGDGCKGTTSISAPAWSTGRACAASSAATPPSLTTRVTPT